MLAYWIVNIVIMIICIHSTLAGGTTQNPPRTQVNQVTRLFDDNIENKGALEQSIDNDRQSAINRLRPDNNELTQLPNDNTVDVQSQTDKLSNIDANSLEAYGNSSEAAAEFSRGDWLIDRNSPGIKPHIEDAENIANASDQLMNHLLDELKKQGINCREVVRNDTIDPQWRIEIDKIKERESIYDKHYCEHRRDSYSCVNSLELVCRQFSSRSNNFSFNSVTAGLRYTTDVRELSTIFSFSALANDSSTNRTGRKDSFFTKRNRSVQHNPTIKNYVLEFDINIDPRVISKLELYDLSYATFLELNVNGTIAYVGPMGGYRLEHNGFVEEVKKGKRKYAKVAGKKQKLKTYYPKIETGDGTYALGKDVNGRTRGVRVDIAPYIRGGRNSLAIKTISISAASIEFKIEAAERICLNWVESWREECKIIPNEP